MVRNKKFHVFRPRKHQPPTWSGKNDEEIAPLVIWAKDLKDAQNILNAGNHDTSKLVIVEAKEY